MDQDVKLVSIAEVQSESDALLLRDLVKYQRCSATGTDSAGP